MRVGEVAQAAGVPRETLRTWLRDPIFDPPEGKPSGGWRRFYDLEVIGICVFARLVEVLGTHEAAKRGMLQITKLLMDEWVDSDGVPYFSDSTFERDRFMYIWRDESGLWDAKVTESDNEISEQFEERMHATYTPAIAFTIVNLRRMLLDVKLSMLKVEAEMISEGKSK